MHTPRHARSLGELSAAEAMLVAEAWRRRAGAAAAAGFPYLHAFVNEGHGAGASLPHSHSQLVWLREPPPAVLAEMGGTCGVCELLADELRHGARTVGERGGIVAVCPAAGRSPYELVLAPAAHCDSAFGPSLDTALAFLVELVRALRAVEGPLPWNAWLHLGPHWHLEVVPRLSTFAGVELGAGIFVLTVAPEDAAEALRAAL